MNQTIVLATPHRRYDRLEVVLRDRGYRVVHTLPAVARPRGRRCQNHRGARAIQMTAALVIAANPDDEVLGCSGTIASLADANWDVHLLIMAEGATSRAPQRSRRAKRDELSSLAASARRAQKILGAASLVLESFPDNRMDGVDLLDVVKVVERAIAQHKPSLVFTHNAGDLNIDHQCVHDAVVTAARRLPGQCIQELLFHEVPSNTEWRPGNSRSPFVPSLYYGIAEQLPRKTRGAGGLRR